MRAAVQPRRRGNGREISKVHARALNQDQTDAPGGQHRLQRATVQKANDGGFQDQPKQGCGKERSGKGGQIIRIEPALREIQLKAFLHDEGRIGADHHQLAMRHVDDTHQAKHDREPEGHDEENGTQTDAAKQGFDRAGPDIPGFDPFDRSGGGLCHRLLLSGRGLAISRLYQGL